MATDLETLRAARTDAALLDRSDRVRLEVAGPDRAKFLHNLTTNEVKRLAAGRGVEAFVTSPQGKTLGFVTLAACDDRILVRTDPGGAALIVPHLEKYGVFDEVTMSDVGPATFEYHLVGPRAGDRVLGAGGALPPEGDLDHTVCRVAGRPLRVVCESPLGLPGLTLIGDRADVAPVLEALRAGGLPALDDRLAEALRIEAGTPSSGRDVTADNLPQEVGRDARAINFVKGCYLGQETVARIDALGHVNRHLRGLTFPSAAEGAPAPPPGSAIEAGGKAVGAVTSSSLSPWRGGPVALGYVRTAQAAPGTPVEVVTPDGRLAAIVSELPMPPA